MITCISILGIEELLKGGNSYRGENPYNRSESALGNIPFIPYFRFKIWIIFLAKSLILCLCSICLSFLRFVCWFLVVRYVIFALDLHFSIKISAQSCIYSYMQSNQTFFVMVILCTKHYQSLWDYILGTTESEKGLFWVSFHQNWLDFLVSSGLLFLRDCYSSICSHFIYLFESFEEVCFHRLFFECMPCEILDHPVILLFWFCFVCQ